LDAAVTATGSDRGKNWAAYVLPLGWLAFIYIQRSLIILLVLATTGLTDADMATCVDGCNGYYGRMNAKHV
jgi:hypothetical protein